MKAARTFVVPLLILCCALPLAGQRRRDPLNSKETDELRATAQEPEKRFKLYVKFAKTRMATIEQLRSDPRFALDRGPQVHDLIEDFGNIVDEMDRNIDSYAGKYDIRKALGEIIQAETEWQLRLRGIKDSLSDAAYSTEARDYKFVIDDAIETVNMSLDNARQLLQEQNEKFSKKKK